MGNENNKKKTIWYTICRFWFLFVFCGSAANAVTFVAAGVSLPISSYTSWSVMLLGQELAVQDPTLLPYFAFTAIAAAVPFLLAFILSGKRFGWTKVGFIYYSIDTALQIMDIFIVMNDVRLLIFYIIGIVIHLAGMALLIIGMRCGAQLFAAYSFGAQGGAYSHSDGAFRTVRTVCLIRESNAAFFDIQFAYHVNGSYVGTVSNGETKIFMVDGNYQRLVITGNGCIPTEVVIPAGAGNTTYAIGAYMTSSGQIGIVATAAF